jgi:hypothetical protein
MTLRALQPFLPIALLALSWLTRFTLERFGRFDAGTSRWTDAFVSIPFVAGAASLAWFGGVLLVNWFRN